MKLSDEMFADALISAAVIENHKREMDMILPGEENLSFSGAHEQRIHVMFAWERAKKIMGKVFNYSARVASYIAIVIALAGALLMTQSEVRAVVRETVVEWYEAFINFRFFQDHETPAVNSEAPYFEPKYLPESFTETYSEILFESVTKIYSSFDEIDVLFTAHPIGSGAYNVDNEHTRYEVEYRDGAEYHVLESTDEEYPSHILWQMDGYEFTLNGNIPMDELWKMALSVSTDDEK
jgi:hypothetical protein